MRLLLGDCREQLKKLKPGSIDAVVTDPPYAIGFMSRGWDSKGIAYSVDLWGRVLLALKPGGHLLAFGGTRTYHRMTCAIEDAGFEIRDCIQWLYGSGFPKSLDVSKAIDKAAGGKFKSNPASGVGFMNAEGKGGYNTTKNQLNRDGKSTESAKKWAGWGTALKPANEPIVLARKPLSCKSVAANVKRYGTGALNIDGARIGNDIVGWGGGGGGKSAWKEQGLRDAGKPRPVKGRFPANVILDKEAGEMLGAVARFFYCPKASKSDRGRGNIHATVKPHELMKYLVRLITPPGGTVLDPFMGSGSTGVAAKALGFDFVGIERNPYHLRTSKKRISAI